MKKTPVVISLALGLASAACLAVTPVPPGGTVVLGADTLSGYKVISDGPQSAQAGWTDVTNGPVRGAWRLETLRQPANPWNFQLQGRNQTAVKRGDTMWARMFLRSTGSLNETGEGQMTFVFETAGPEHVKSIDITVSAGAGWREVCFPFLCRNTLREGEAFVTLRAGFRRQTIEVGGVEVIDYGPGRKPESLPRTSMGYAGREADAAWRADADRRIETIRKGDFTVQVVDAAGRPLPGAKVELKLHRHAFGFGSAIDSAFLLGGGTDSARYREVVERDFSRIVYENELKWHNWERADAGSRARTVESFDWFKQRGIAIRGHVLVWPSWRNSPRSVRALEHDPAALSARISAHIQEMVTLSRGRFHDWDVVNEPYANHDLMGVLGDGAMVDWYKQAHAIDPHVVLFLNDYAGLAAGGMNTAHKDHFEKTARFLKDKGAPIGGIGLQCHFGWSVTPPVLALKELDRWAKLGLQIHLTEFDIDTTDELLQADYTRDLLTLAFSHPSVTTIMAWGFWEGRHWRPDAAMWRKDWSIKPNGKVWEELTTRKWWTHEAGATGADGTFRARGFFGDYDITVSAGGSKRSVVVPLTNLQSSARVICE